MRVYVSNTASIDLITLAKERVEDHPLLTHTLVKEVRVDLSYDIHQFLFGSNFVGSSNTI